MQKKRMPKKRLFIFALILTMMCNLMPVNLLTARAEETVGTAGEEENFAAVNLVAGGDFESTVEATATSGFNQTIGSWTFYVKPGSDTSLTISTVSGRTGSALQVSGTTDTYVKVNQNILLEEGKTYTGSVWVKSAGAVGYPEGAQAKAQLNLGFGKVLVNLPATDCAADWVEVPFTYKATATEEVNLGLGICNTTSGTWLIDDFTLTQIPNTINLDRETAEVVTGNTLELAATIIGAETVVEWSSANESIATVTANASDSTKAAVTAVAEGATAITATLKNARGEFLYAATCAVTVIAGEGQKNYVFNGNFEYDTDAALLNFSSGNSSTLIGDSGWTGWTANGSQNMDYQVVKEGRNDSHAMKITRTAAGTTTARGVLSQNVEGLTVGENYKVSVWAKIVNETSQSTNSYIRITDSGEEKTLAAITNVQANGEWMEHTYEFMAKSTTVNIQIHGANPQTGYVLVDDVSIKRVPKDPVIRLTPSGLELEVGAESVITAQIEDPDQVLSDAGTIRFSSEDPTVASVDEEGKVTAIAAGTTDIIVTAANGPLSAVCAVTVSEKQVPLTQLSLKETTLELCAGSRKQLEAEFVPENADVQKLTWSSSDESVASVDENGLVTAWKQGSAVITAATDENLTASCSVTVRESTTLTTNKAAFETGSGVRLTDSLNKKDYVTNQTGSGELSFQILKKPESGTLQLDENGDFVYVPGNYDTCDSYADTFFVGVTAASESAVICAEITVKELEENIASALREKATLLITRGQLEEVKKDIQNPDSVKYKIWNQYKPYLEYLLTTDAPQDQNPACPREDCSEDSQYESQWQRDVGDSIAHLLMGYLLTGETAYREKCIEYAMASVNYKHWGSISMYKEADLAAGHQAFALGLVYNWLNEELTDDQKAQIVKKVYDTCAKFETRNGDSTNYQQNHLWVTMTGLCSASMAFYMDADGVAKALGDGTTAETVKENCVRWLDLVYEKTGNSFKWAATDGASHEGAGYFTYGLEYLMKTALLLNNNLGIDLITDNAWMEHNSEYFLNVIYPKNSISPEGSLIDYADGTRTNWYGPSHLFRVLAAQYNDETAQWIAETFENADADYSGSCIWLGLLFATDEVEAKLDSNRSNLYYAEDLGIVTARTDWSGDESLVFLRSGLPLGKTGLELLTLGSSEFHVDPDCNALILYSNGEYLLRTDGYAKQKRTKNHSTLLIDGNGQIGGNDATAGMVGDLFYTLGLEPEIKVTAVGDGYSYFVGDATEAYHPDYGLRKFERNVVLLEEENVLLVVDNIKTSENKDLELRWFPESKNVTEAYGIYTVSGSNNVMKFYPLTEDTKTEFKDADVYITSADNQTEKAFIQTFNGVSWQNAAAFAWSGAGENQTYVKYTEGNANEHKFEVNGKIYTVNVANNTVKVEEGTLGLAAKEHESDSSLSKILLNGLDLENFDSEKTEYTVERFWKVDELKIVAMPGSPSASVEVKWDGTWPGTATIVCTSGDRKNSTEYQIHLTDTQGLLSIQSAKAEPNMFGYSADFTYDSYIQEDGTDKTWSSTNLPALTWDMGKLVDITKIDAAFNSSRDRNTYYNLLISQDGETWITVQEADDKVGGAAKTTTRQRSDYLTIYEGEGLRARYVQMQLRAHSNTVIDDAKVYNSIQEISFYGRVVSADAPGAGDASGSGNVPGTDNASGSGNTPGTGDASGSGNAPGTGDASGSGNAPGTGDASGSGNTSGAGNRSESSDTSGAGNADTSGSGAASEAAAPGPVSSAGAATNSQNVPTGDSTDGFLSVIMLILSAEVIVCIFVIHEKTAKRKKQR
ncbi:MAG: Ig-like domain-containing protein [Lachnospiraceae bacterium]|nr:Ig-like domain-containing protein [Lachnospiraceae bacterium]